MKNKFKFFGTLTLAAVCGLSLASCKTDGNNSGNNSGNNNGGNNGGNIEEGTKPNESTMPKYDV